MEGKRDAPSEKKKKKPKIKTQQFILHKTVNI